MYVIYWEHMAGSIVVQATLETIGAEYQTRYVDMASGEHHSPEFLNVNPVARVPALGLPDGTTIGETGAIVTLLGERHRSKAVTPQPGEEDRAAFLYWLNVMSTAGYVTSSRVGHPERFAKDDDAIAQVKRQADKDFAAFFALMDRVIAGEPYLLKRGLTALDFYLTMLTEWVDDRDALLKARPRLRDLCLAVGDTPAYRTAIKTHAIPNLEATG